MKCFLNRFRRRNKVISILAIKYNRDDVGLEMIGKSWSICL